jgi:single-stranded DNA-binding protein
VASLRDSVNEFVVRGRLTVDPAGFGSGSRFSVAVDNGYMQNGAWIEKVSFFEVITEGQNSNFVKGSVGVVRGMLQNNSYTNAAGEKVYTTPTRASKAWPTTNEPRHNQASNRPPVPAHDDVAAEDLPF